jgi:hypothetical protein
VSRQGIQGFAQRHCAEIDNAQLRAMLPRLVIQVGDVAHLDQRDNALPMWVSRGSLWVPEALLRWAA